MKNLKSILNQKFTFLAATIFFLVLIVQVLSILSTYSQFKREALETTNVLADYFEPTILFESTVDFNSIIKKLDFERKFVGITLYDKFDNVIAAKGDPIDQFRGPSVYYRDNRIFTRVEIQSNDKSFGSVYVTYSTQNLVEEVVFSLIFFVIMLIFLFIVFYVYIKQINQIVVTPINKFIKSIDSFDENNHVNLNIIESEVLEIHELKENFTNLVFQINFSRKQLENWNKKLERNVSDKTSELKIALEEMRKFQKKVIAQEKLASLGGLTAGIAHEIKNPLNLIINSAQLIPLKLSTLDKIIKAKSEQMPPDFVKNFQETNQDLAEICNIINKSGLRADRIIKGMLSQARTTSNERSVFNLTEVFKQGLNLAYHAMRAKPNAISIELIEEIQPDIEFECIGDELERAIINLLDNSFYALAEKKAKDTTFIAKLIVKLFIKNQFLYIMVEDNGVGIAKENIDKVKEPFFTTKPTGLGTGLGLSMINDIVTSQNGEFIIESELNKFTRFTLQFPYSIPVKKSAIS